MHITRLPVLALISCSMLLLPCISAAEPQKKTYTFASKEQLRVCLSSQDALAKQKKSAEAMLAENRADLAAITSEAEEIIQQQQRVITSEEAEVNAFNQLVASHNEHVQNTNTKAEKFKTELDAYNQAMLAHNRACSTLIYRVEDKAAVLKERESLHK